MVNLSGLVDDSASQVGDGPGHRRSPIGGHEGRYIRQLEQRCRTSPVSVAVGFATIQ
jgi:hypothetical protein